MNRSAFFNAYWEALGQRGWSAVILHSWKDYPEEIDSDVDYSIQGCSSAELLCFLEEFSRSCGWALVQVVEHEPQAFMCTCMRRDRPEDTLILDVTGDYRRMGHILLPAAQLHCGSRIPEGKKFKVPSVGAEAAYLVAKAAAKSKPFREIQPRLGELLLENSESVLNALQAAYHQDPPPAEVSRSTEALEDWFQSTDCLKAVRKGRRLGYQEILLYLRRCRSPTGFWIRFSGNEPDATLIEKCVEPFVPLFRRCEYFRGLTLKDLPKVRELLIRTSLVVEKGHDSSSGEGGSRVTLSNLGKKNFRQLQEEVIEALSKRSRRRVQRMGR